jgi:hypothetical protein
VGLPNLASGSGRSPCCVSRFSRRGSGPVIALVVAAIESHFTDLAVARGAVIGVLLWLIAGATSFGTSLFSYQPRALWMINTGYNLVSMVIAGVILAVWR